jgi:hypothetical protein
VGWSGVERSERLTCCRDFDAGVAALALNVMPSVVASKAYKARQVLWDTVFSFYKAEYWKNGDVSPLMRMRAEKLTRDGLPWDAIAKIEINIPWASVTNSPLCPFSVVSGAKTLFRAPETTENIPKRRS